MRTQQREHGRSRRGGGVYKRDIQNLKQRAEETRKQLKALTGTQRSPDGAVTATVNAGGQLQSLTFGAAADSMPRARLAELVLATARQAQAKADSQITKVMAPLIGDDSPAMHRLKDEIPVIDLPDDSTAGPQPPAQQAVQPPQPQRPTHRSQRTDRPEEDFEATPVTREDDW